LSDGLGCPAAKTLSHQNLFKLRTLSPVFSGKKLLAIPLIADKSFRPLFKYWKIISPENAVKPWLYYSWTPQIDDFRTLPLGTLI